MSEDARPYVSDVESSTPPDWDAIDGDIFDADEPEPKLTPAELDAVQKMFRRVLGWVFHDAMNRAGGVSNRAIVACWVFLPQLQPLTLTQISLGFGKNKQSLGREVEAWKAAFPTIRTRHMR